MRLLFVFVFLSSVAFGQIVYLGTGTPQPKCSLINGFEFCDDVPNKVFFISTDKGKQYTGCVKCCEKGRVTDLYFLKNGLMDSVDMDWYDNGQLLSQTNYKDGFENGKQKYWHSNGVLWITRNWKSGKINGFQTIRYENGMIKNKTFYKNGELIFKDCFDEDGNKIECKH